MNRDDVANINELKNYFEEYLRGGMCQYEAPFIGRNDVTTMLKVFKALDKACKELEELEKKCYYESVTFKHCKSASEWRKEMLGE